MVGLSIGSYDLLRSWVREEALGFPVSKVVRGVAGGAAGGLLGGILDWRLGGPGPISFPPRAISGARA